jgi:hypothetical protein
MQWFLAWRICVAILAQAMNELVSEGHRIDPEAVAFLSPYITQHFVRFGLYPLDHTRQPSPLTYEIAIPNPEEALEEVSEAVRTNSRIALSKWPKFARGVDLLAGGNRWYLLESGWHRTVNWRMRLVDDEAF